MFYYITKYKCFSTDNSQHKVWKRAFFYAFVLLRITEIFLPSQPSGPNLPSQFPGFFYLSKLVFTYSVYIPLFTQSHPQDFSNNFSIILLVLVAIYAKIKKQIFWAYSCLDLSPVYAPSLSPPSSHQS